jgi:hypothetical protein
MTNEQINIAIAEHRGWRIAERVSPEVKESATACWIRPNGNEWQEENLPDYCSDLNAMHEAVKTLQQNLKHRYFACLCTVVSGAISLNGYSAATEATARQRAEAFLRTLGKWEDAK